MVVVNKPAPLPMHPCGRFNRNTLISLLNQVYAPQVLRVAHRLDANTTGVVVLSCTRAAASLLQPQFEGGEVQKRYLAQVEGHPPDDWFCCEAPIAETPLPRGERQISSDGLSSRSEFRVLGRRPDHTSLIEARPMTGRTNQIRLHLAHLGWPVCGDPVYGAASQDARATLSCDDPPMRLHAWQLTFAHPLHGKTVTFTAAPPAWFPREMSSDVTQPTFP
jgi:RluA family pseudouridine synthase